MNLLKLPKKEGEGYLYIFHVRMTKTILGDGRRQMLACHSYSNNAMVGLA